MALKYFTNRNVMKVLNKGVSFRPMDLDSEATPNVFYYQEETNDTLYIAIFNHTEKSSEISFNIDRIVENATSNLKLSNLWTEKYQVLPGSGIWTFDVNPKG